jgi:hypothetical protein
MTVRLLSKPTPPNAAKDDQNDHSQAEANDHLGDRFDLVRFGSCASAIISSCRLIQKQGSCKSCATIGRPMAALGENAI